MPDDRKPRTRSINPRRVAIEIISQALSPSGHAFAQDLIEERILNSPMKAEDRRLASELAYGVIRRLGTLDGILAAYSSRPLASLDASVLQALRLGLYQMIFMDRIPAHAAVDESVSLARSTGKARAAGFVNAILREVSRGISIAAVPGSNLRRSLHVSTSRTVSFTRDVLPDPSAPAARLSAVHSFPQSLAARWISNYGRERADELMEAANHPAAIFLRPNSLKTDVEKLAARLREEGIEAEPSPSGRTLRAPSNVNVAKVAAFREGLCTVQDDSSAAVAPFLEAKPGEHVADLCAAPGGKCSHIAEMMQNKGIIAAVDISTARLGRVVENAQRLGLSIIATVEADAALFCAQHPGKFDRILLDAPCSNTGVLRRRVEARWRFSAEALARIVAAQRKMLAAALGALRPGGALVYSTCSLEPEENERLVEAVVKESSGVALDAMRQLLPSLDGGDGIFMARIRKS